jgi:hypothetical protein
MPSDGKSSPWQGELIIAKKKIILNTPKINIGQPTFLINDF